MAGITEEETWDSEVYQLETTDPVQGGPEGIDNLPHKALANRTLWLKAQLLLKALKGGSATQLFKVKAAVASDEAVNKGQMETALSNLDNVKVIQVKVLSNNTRYSGVSKTAGEKLNFGSLTKLRADTSLVLHLTVPFGTVGEADYTGHYVKYGAIQTEEGFSYIDAQATYMNTISANTVLRGCPLGTNNIIYGYPRSNANGVGSVINPNSSDDTRLAQTASVCTVYEVLEG